MFLVAYPKGRKPKDLEVKRDGKDVAVSAGGKTVRFGADGKYTGP